MTHSARGPLTLLMGDKDKYMVIEAAKGERKEPLEHLYDFEYPVIIKHQADTKE